MSYRTRMRAYAVVFLLIIGGTASGASEVQDSYADLVWFLGSLSGERLQQMTQVRWVAWEAFTPEEQRKVLPSLERLLPKTILEKAGFWDTSRRSAVTFRPEFFVHLEGADGSRALLWLVQRSLAPVPDESGYLVEANEGSEGTGEARPGLLVPLHLWEGATVAEEREGAAGAKPVPEPLESGTLARSDGRPGTFSASDRKALFKALNPWAHYWLSMHASNPPFALEEFTQKRQYLYGGLTREQQAWLAARHHDSFSRQPDSIARPVASSGNQPPPLEEETRVSLSWDVLVGVTSLKEVDDADLQRLQTLRARAGRDTRALDILRGGLGEDAPKVWLAGEQVFLSVEPVLP